MSDDYTPGHALRDIAVVVPQINHDYVNACIVRLYKAGQANERAAIVAGLRGLDDMGRAYADDFADLIERGSS